MPKTKKATKEDLRRKEMRLAAGGRAAGVGSARLGVHRAKQTAKSIKKRASR